MSTIMYDPRNPVIELTGEEDMITDFKPYYMVVTNNSNGVVYVSNEPQIMSKVGSSKVTLIPPGATRTVDLDVPKNRFFAIGNGSITVKGTDLKKDAEEETRTSIFIESSDSCSNLLINPDFKINQRNASGTITTPGYFVDRWQLVSGSVTINSDGTLMLNGTIKQILENGAGTNVSADSSAGTTAYDDNSKTFLLTAAGEAISWVKLEKGSISTQFVPPDPTTELLKCQRYFHRLGGKNRCFRLYGIACDSHELRVSYQLPAEMRVTPTLTSSPGSWRFYISKISTDSAAFWNNEYGAEFAINSTFSSPSNVEISVTLDSSKTVTISAGDSMMIGTNPDSDSSGNQKYPGWLDFDAEII